MQQGQEGEERAWPPTPVDQTEQAETLPSGGVWRTVVPALAGASTGLLFTPLAFFVMILLVPGPLPVATGLKALSAAVLLAVVLSAVLSRHSRVFAIAFAVAAALASVACYWLSLVPEFTD